MVKGVLCDPGSDDPVLFGPQQLVSSTKLVRNMSSYLNMAQTKPVFVERDQEVEAVLISIDSYRELLKEERKARELYLITKGMRRLIEAVQSKGSTLIPFESVAKEFGISGDDFEEVK